MFWGKKKKPTPVTPAYFILHKIVNLFAGVFIFEFKHMIAFVLILRFEFNTVSTIFSL